jgi:hypothetical protein
MVIGCYYLTAIISNKNFGYKKWFGNENEVLAAFYQKKISLHSPVLVRYSIANFKIKLEGGKLLFSDTLTNLKTNEQEVIVEKIFQLTNGIKKYYLLTNIGVLIADYINTNNYELTDLFLKTSPGRLIFSNNFKNSIKKQEYVN